MGNFEGMKNVLISHAQSEYTKHNCDLQTALHNIPENVMMSDMTKFVVYDSKNLFCCLTFNERVKDHYFSPLKETCDKSI